MESSRNILLLDADGQSAQDIQSFLKVSAYAFSISHASGIQEGMSYLNGRRPDIILLDGDVLKESDFEQFKQLAEKENIPIILLSDVKTGEIRRQAEQAGASDYLAKSKINLFHLQKIILNTLKINETENKPDATFSQFNTKQNTLYKLLDKTNSGILVIDANNSILYANTKAYSILGDEDIRNHLSRYLAYRELEEDELLELRPKKNLAIRIKISATDWNDEKANLFIIDRLRIKDNTAASFLSNQIFITFLNSLSENVLLLHESKIVFGNKPALLKLNLTATEIYNRQPKDIFSGDIQLQTKVSVQDFFGTKESKAVLRGTDGSIKEVKILIKPLNLADAYYEMLLFEIKGEEQGINFPKGRSSEDRFSTEGILHMASHDLREPVRTILNYVQLISENLNNKKYDAATEYADFARAAADRMDKLLSDLKVYVALNDYKFTTVKVSMKLAVTDVLKQLKPKIEQAGAEINVVELPDVNADRELVEKLLFQLIDNALKFQKKGKRMVIDIGFDKFEGKNLFCVRDNGIGISKKYQEKVFGLFERLNRVDEYPGNGLGLAICKKIVDMHGGKIWVESTPGLGSSFYFCF